MSLFSSLDVRPRSPRKSLLSQTQQATQGLMKTPDYEGPRVYILLMGVMWEFYKD